MMTMMVVAAMATKIMAATAIVGGTYSNQLKAAEEEMAMAAVAVAAAKATAMMTAMATERATVRGTR